MEIFAFILISIGFILIPGPNILVIVSTSLSNGKKRGLQTVAGTSIAMMIQLLIVALSTTWLVTNLARGLFYLKWIGVAYLIYVGIKQLLKVFKENRDTDSISAMSSIKRGFWTSLTNPKTILFFSAFLPQFVTDSRFYTLQICILSILFLLLAVALDSLYALISGKLSALVQSGTAFKFQSGISGILYIGAGVVLGITNRRQ